MMISILEGFAKFGSESLIFGNLISSGIFSGLEEIAAVRRGKMNAETSWEMEFSSTIVKSVPLAYCF